jgi:tetratricopeptide (TPR) repeat protein
VLGLGAAVIVASVGLLAFRHGNTVRLEQQAHALLESGQEHLRKDRPDEAATTARHGLALAGALPSNQEIVGKLNRLLRDVERVQTGRELTALADRLRLLYGVDSISTAELQALETRCRRFWENRTTILEQLRPEPTSDFRAPNVESDLLDLALLWTDLRLRLATPENKAATRREALFIMDQAEALFGPSAVLSQQRHAHASALGIPAAAEPTAPAPHTAWEHYALGRVLYQAGDVEAAAASFHAACALQPQGFWPNFYAGLCAHRQRRCLEAVAAFSVCIGSDARNAICYFNRALAHTALGRDDLALADYDRALVLDSKLAPAALNRGLLHYRHQRYVHSIADLQRALALGASAATVHYNLALVYVAQSNHAAALLALQESLRHDPEHRAARDLHQTLQRQK